MATDPKTGYSVEYLTPEKFAQFWPEIEGMLDKVPHTWEDLTKESIYSRIMSGGLQAWAVGASETVQMVFFTQIAIYAAGDVLQMIWAAGQGKIFEPAGDIVEAVIENFAKARGCRRIDIIGRGGWEKVLEDRGFKRTAVVLTRRVVHSGMQ